MAAQLELLLLLLQVATELLQEEFWKQWNVKNTGGSVLDLIMSFVMTADAQYSLHVATQ